MGSYDGAEVCELVATYILTKVREKTKENKIKFGLYRDDGLAIADGQPREIEKLKKKIAKVFKEEGLRITIDANKSIVNFLDVTLNMKNGTYRPYLKPGNTPKYVNKQSNHPPKILKAIPNNINNRLSTISCNEKVFKESTETYQQALRESGYNHKLKYEEKPK